MEITDTTEIEEASGYEHGVFDAQSDSYPLAQANPRAWDNSSVAYQAGYEAGYDDGKPSIG